MVRSYWKRTLASTLACAGLAFGQQPAVPPAPIPPAAPADQTERTMTVQEMGKPPLKCKILKTWKTAEGTNAYQVQALTTAEMITVVENGTATPLPGQPAGSRLHAVSTRIYHWGRGLTPPPGCPVPPVAVAAAPAAPRPPLPPPPAPPRPPAPGLPAPAPVEAPKTEAPKPVPIVAPTVSAPEVKAPAAPEAKAPAVTEAPKPAPVKAPPARPTE